MQVASIQGSLNVFYTEGCYCASFVAPGYPLLATRSEDRESLDEWLADIGVDEELLTGKLPIVVEVSLSPGVVIPSAESLVRRFSKQSAYMLSKVVFQPPGE
jgi:hypothetical protein